MVLRWRSRGPAMGLDLNSLPPGMSERIRAMIVQGEDVNPGRDRSRSETCGRDLRIAAETAALECGSTLSSASGTGCPDFLPGSGPSPGPAAARSKKKQKGRPSGREYAGSPPCGLVIQGKPLLPHGIEDLPFHIVQGDPPCIEQAHPADAPDTLPRTERAPPDDMVRNSHAFGPSAKSQRAGREVHK